MKYNVFLLVLLVLTACSGNKKSPSETFIIPAHFQDAKKSSFINVDLAEKGYVLTVGGASVDGITYLLGKGSSEENRTIEFTNKQNGDDDYILSLRTVFLDFVSDGSKGKDFVISTLPYFFRSDTTILKRWIVDNWATNKEDTINGLIVRMNSSDRAFIFNILPTENENNTGRD